MTKSSINTKPSDNGFSPIVPILLAAGLSRRMGRTNKLLMTIDGVPLVRHSARILTNIGKTIVVVGHESDAVVAALDGLNVAIVHNDKYTKGQMQSVTVGLQYAPPAAHYMIALADQPRLTTEDCEALIAAHDKAGIGKITVPFHAPDARNGGQPAHKRGNPIILDEQARSDILCSGTNLGCRGLLDRRPNIIFPYETSADGFFIDLDTPQAFEAERGHPAPAPSIV